MSHKRSSRNKHRYDPPLPLLLKVTPREPRGEPKYEVLSNPVAYEIKYGITYGIDFGDYRKGYSMKMYDSEKQNRKQNRGRITILVKFLRNEGIHQNGILDMIKGYIED